MMTFGSTIRSLYFVRIVWSQLFQLSFVCSWPFNLKLMWTCKFFGLDQPGNIDRSHSAYVMNHRIWCIKDDKVPKSAQWLFCMEFHYPWHTDQPSYLYRCSKATEVFRIVVLTWEGVQTRRWHWKLSEKNDYIALWSKIVNFYTNCLIIDY